MKLLIEIPDITYKRTLEIGALQICTDNDIYRWIANGTPIPENATDAIKAIFPNAKITYGLHGFDGAPLIGLNLGTNRDKDNELTNPFGDHSTIFGG